jgi:hypothetical protein
VGESGPADDLATVEIRDGGQEQPAIEGCGLRSHLREVAAQM